MNAFVREPSIPRWRQRSLRWQVLAAVVVINLCAALLAIAVIIANARRATEIEMVSSVAVAERFVEETVERLAAVPGGSSLAQLPLHITGLRHVRIRIEDAGGKVVDIRSAEEEDGGDGEAEKVPDWFTDLITVDRAERDIAVVENGQTIGKVRVAGEASDEIAEVWEDMSDLALLAIAVNIAILAALYFVLGRLLLPLRTLSAGLSELEAGHFEHRMPIPSLQELAIIADRFNALGAALKLARDDNVRLNERLIRVQDDERRQIASDLHDELGPCVFGLRANIESVNRLVARAELSDGGAVGERMATMTDILDRIQSLNRRLLRKIRPMALGHVPLTAVIADLVADFESHSPGRHFRLVTEDIAERYGDSIDITVYRCIQEAVTNALRHGDASHVLVELQHDRHSRRLSVVVEDNGSGMAPGTASGFGFIGIEERLSALSGRWRVLTVSPHGTRVEIDIPTSTESVAAEEASEPVVSKRANAS